VGSAPVRLVSSKKPDRRGGPPTDKTADPVMLMIASPRDAASLAVQRVLARERVLSLDETRHPLRRFVEKRVSKLVSSVRADTLTVAPCDRAEMLTLDRYRWRSNRL